MVSSSLSDTQACNNVAGVCCARSWLTAPRRRLLLGKVSAGVQRFAQFDSSLYCLSGRKAGDCCVQGFAEFKTRKSGWRLHRQPEPKPAVKQRQDQPSVSRGSILCKLLLVTGLTVRMLVSQEAQDEVLGAGG